MMKVSSRRGSALLIVLGMLAFMIVSAVAFSAYMRFSRMPSSYLRRTSSSRLLVKAGLARAIDEIDRSLGNSLHPGISAGTGYGRWKNRVFFGTNITNTLMSLTSTVPIVTLEGLAYIPPALVNDVRYYARYTPTAAWKSFSFDVGRYAYCAIDVSDYFDVNRLAADRPRASADDRRVSLSYLFENTQHTSSDSKATAWDKWMETFRSEDEQTFGFRYDNKVPLVSVADMNLALGESGIGGFYSPFCKYVNGTGDAGFNTFGGEQEEDLVRRMTFVTDSWLPTSKEQLAEEAGYDDVYDLTTAEGQPFEYEFLNGAGGPRGDSAKNTTINAIMTHAGPSERLVESFPGLGHVALYDYLDTDSVPVTLASPTFERTPMVCGLRPNFNTAQLVMKEPTEGPVSLAATADAAAPSENTGPRTVYQKVTYAFDTQKLLDGLMQPIDALVVYPFAHKDEVQDSFSVDGRATLFWTVEGAGMSLRTRNSKATEVLHLSQKEFMNEKGLNAATGCLVVPYEPVNNRSFGKDTVKSEEEVIEELPLRMAARDIAGTLNNTPFIEVIYRWEQTWVESGGGMGSYQPANWVAAEDTRAIERAHCNMPPLTAAGEVDARFSNDAEFAKVLAAGDLQLNLNVALHTRIADQDAKTVDLVPACAQDDKTFNNVDNLSGPFGKMVSDYMGKPYPVMRFDTGVKLALSGEGLSQAQTAQTFVMEPTAVLVDDPRFNYAPESWYRAADFSKQAWLDNNHSAERNGDIFMATSDQGYLQSIYEFAFLPRYSNLAGTGGNAFMGDLQTPEDGRTAFGEQSAARNTDLMWDSIRIYGNNRDDVEGIGFSSAGCGFKVNPYTDSTNVLMAAFANTPVNWRMASTNNQEVTLEELSASEFNKKYAWNEYGAEDANFAWQDLEGIAGAFMTAISPTRQSSAVDALLTPGAGGGGTEWQTAWNNLWQTADTDTFGSYTLQNTALWSVDRKFLYGYWRDCFAARQQLFLVFVRAEPLMMGGGSLGRIPPQLGARAVALVWRDPTPTTQAADATGDATTQGYPHRTRILFYKQLD